MCHCTLHTADCRLRRLQTEKRLFMRILDPNAFDDLFFFGRLEVHQRSVSGRCRKSTFDENPRMKCILVTFFLGGGCLEAWLGWAGLGWAGLATAAGAEHCVGLGWAGLE